MQRPHQLLRDPQRDGAERNGLHYRYETVTANAAFSLLEMEGNPRWRATVISSKIDEMTDTMVRYARRVASLAGQIDFVTDLDQQVELFSPENVSG